MDPFRLEAQPEDWLRVRPTPDADTLRAFYAGRYYQEAHGTYEASYSAEETAHRRLIADLMIHAVESARGRPLGSRDTLLDVGCGEGWLLQAAADRGCRVRGMDFSAFALRRHHPELEPSVFFGDVFEALERPAAAADRADVCVLEHVLEHVADPERLLRSLPGALSPGGLLVITVPNDFSATQMLAREVGAIEGEPWVQPPEHLNYFNTDTLPRLLERAGYAVVGGYCSFPIDWFLLHPGSNYARLPEAGKAAHHARLKLDLMLAARGMEAYHALASALFACGAGRSATVIARVPA